LAIGTAPWLIIRKQVQFLTEGFTPKSLAFCGVKDPYQTQCVIGPRKCIRHVNPLNGFCRVHEYDRRQANRQTDHTTEKWYSYR